MKSMLSLIRVSVVTVAVSLTLGAVMEDLWSVVEPEATMWTTEGAVRLGMEHSVAATMFLD